MTPERRREIQLASYHRRKRLKRPLAPWELFWGKVCAPGPTVRAELGPCWVWTGSIGHYGYGRLWLGGQEGGSHPTHRLAWQMTRGPIADELCVCHHCDNPACVRPDHLFLGTKADNHRDMREKGRDSPPPVRAGAENGNSRAKRFLRCG